MKKNKDYNFNQIETFSDENDFELIEFGGNTLGKSFIVLDSNTKDITVSFILTGYNSVEGNIYTCVYSDLN